MINDYVDVTAILEGEKDAVVPAFGISATGALVPAGEQDFLNGKAVPATLGDIEEHGLDAQSLIAALG